MTSRLHIGGKGLGLVVALVAALCIPLAGCGSSGSDGTDGQDGASTGLLTGTVTNASDGNAAMAGVTLDLSPAAGGTVTTDASGAYSVTLPIGAYSVECAPSGFDAQTKPASILAATTTTVDFAMDATSGVMVGIGGAPSGPAPGSSFGLTATPTVYDGSTVMGYMWEQHAVGGMTTAHEGAFMPPVDIQNGDTANPTITLPALDAYKASLRSFTHLPGRWGVLPATPLALEEAGLVELECTVMTSSGAYTATVSIHVGLPWKVSTGLRNVPTNTPVLMNGKEQASYDWALIAQPAGSTATLMDATTQNPYFTPDVQGLYELSVTDLTEGAVANVIPVYVGDWDGGITGTTTGGNPALNPAGWTTTCTGACHSGIHYDKFEEWAMTGHAEIFTSQVNAGGHYSSNCFACHNVGFDPTADNNGMDEAADFDAFMAALFPGGNSHPDAGNYDEVLDDFPATAEYTNIQCENCHGPNGQFGLAHGWSAPAVVDLTTMNPRMSLASDVCAACHGEPPRHGRYQQWEDSGHGSYETAMDMARGSCVDCHIAAGAIAAFPKFITEDGVADPRPSVDPDAAHPITCVVCHDPHDIGTTSGDGTNAPIRVQDNAYNLAAGYDATNVGKGAICMTCHNSRRGLTNSGTGLSNPDRAPHGGTQTDVVMGQNAFFVDVGFRGAHSFLDDTCVTCHVQLTPPPAELSYNLGGTNHTFEAETTICSDCHGGFDGGTMMAEFESTMDDLEALIADTIYDEIEALLDGGYTVECTGHEEIDEDVDVVVTITDIADVDSISLTESHGRSGMDITVNGVTAWGVRLDGGTVIYDGSMADVGSLASNGLFTGMFGPGPVQYGPEQVMMQAEWNYFLLHSDGSHGFHNPSFTIDIIAASFYELEMLEWNLPL